MGEYFLIVNRTKGEYLHSHKMNQGLKFAEFCLADGSSSMSRALALLLAGSPGPHRYFRDTRPAYLDNAHRIGTWAGHEIVIASDYGDPADFVPVKALEEEGHHPKWNLYNLAENCYTDITDSMRALLTTLNWSEPELDPDQRETVARVKHFSPVGIHNEYFIRGPKVVVDQKLREWFFGTWQSQSRFAEMTSEEKEEAFLSRCYPPTAIVRTEWDYVTYAEELPTKVW